MKNEDCSKESEKATDGKQESSTVTSISPPQKMKPPQITNESTNKNKDVLVGSVKHEMFMSSEMSSEKDGEVKDGPKHEIVSMRDKYAGKYLFFYFVTNKSYFDILLPELVAHNSRLVEILQTTLQLQTDLFSRFLSFFSSKRWKSQNTF